MKQFKQLIRDSRHKYRHVPGYVSYEEYVNGVERLYGDVSHELRRQIGTTIDLNDLIEIERNVRYSDDLGTAMLPHYERHDYLLIESLYDSYPVYLIEKNLAESLTNTDLPTDIPVDNLFQKRGVILLPDPGSDSGSLTAMIFGYSEIDNCMDVLGVQSRYDTRKMRRQGPETIGFTMPRSIFTFWPGKPLEKVKGIRDVNYDQSLNLVYNIFLYLQSAPDDFEEVSRGDTKATATGKGFGTGGQNQGTPVMIGGKRYAKRPSMGGSHVSPTSHWRRGHWRNQPYGSKDSPSYRLKWIEPTLVNAGNPA